MELKLPEFSELGGAEWSGGGEVSEAEIGDWQAADGTAVEAGQPLVEVSLDKATVMLDAPVSGVVHQRVQRGDIVLPGDLIATIDTR
jgi:pyruvate/2-oxoglutarate dehydrogenase complex dihydrolipoamide acyltransferase (E2) component